MRKYVALMLEGVYTVHAPEISGNYATLCGVSDNDNPAHCGTKTILRAGSKITCRVCIDTILLAKHYGARDFALIGERT